MYLEPCFVMPGEFDSRTLPCHADPEKSSNAVVGSNRISSNMLNRSCYSNSSHPPDMNLAALCLLSRWDLYR